MASRSTPCPQGNRALSIEGAVVTIDAIVCQRDIAGKIIEEKADYVLALKGTQGTLRGNVDLFVAEQRANDFKHTTTSRHRTVDGDHGRVVLMAVMRHRPKS